LGGYFQPESQVLIGPMVTKYAGDFFTDKLFLGTDGFIPGQGFTGRNYLCVETALTLTNCASKVYILTDSTKFRHRGAYNMINLDKITGVLTDDSIPTEAETALLDNNVQLYKVPAVEEKSKWNQFTNSPMALY
jgi:DeoR/GlpR family transcriptional regulator of sugar metabolism